MWLAALTLCQSLVGSTVTFHNHSDCCCENIYPRSANNLVSTVSECVQNCAADAQCHAAVYLVTDVAGQCELHGTVPAGKACCIHKKHCDGLSMGSPAGQVVIDMGTSAGPCPKPEPPPTPPKKVARPTYHYTRCSGEMNDPNGLQWRYGPDGKPQFHMFFQAAGAGGCPAGVHGWGHASGPDMVSWIREPASGVCGSSGGGITLPLGFKGPNGESWLSANIASAPFAGQHPAVGLHLFTSTDPGLHNYSRYWPAKKTHLADPCVICPDLVPPSIRPGYIGDNYVFQEPAFNVSSSDRTFYVLSGTNRCTNHTDLWCGYPAPGTPAAMLFSSKDLLTWKFVSLFTDSIRDGHWNYTKKNRVDCPDTFALPDGRQALLWLDSGGTRWNIGTLNRTTMQFTAHHTGIEDHGTGVTQSVWDPHGRRIQIGWIGTPFGAAQTLPHEIKLSSTGNSFLWLPLPEMTTLHRAQRTFSGLLQMVRQNVSSAHPLVNSSDSFGLHMHATATFTFSSGVCENVTLAVTKSSRGLYVDAHCGSVMANLGVLCSLDSSAGGGRVAAAVEPTTTTVAMPLPLGTPSNGSVLTVDVFVDSVVVEVFAGGAHVAHVLDAIDGVTVSGSGVEVGVVGGSVDVDVDLWAMAPSISPACPHDQPFTTTSGTINGMKSDDEQAITHNDTTTGYESDFFLSAWSYSPFPDWGSEDIGTQPMWSVDDWLHFDVASKRMKPYMNFIFASPAPGASQLVWAELSKQILDKTGVNLPMMVMWDAWSVVNVTAADTIASWAQFQADYSTMRKQYPHLPVSPWGITLGDEPAPSTAKRLPTVTAMIRKSYPASILHLNWKWADLTGQKSDAANVSVAKWCGLSELDWISSGEYYDVSIAAFQRSYQERVYPHLKATQRIILLPFAAFCEIMMPARLCPPNMGPSTGVCCPNVEINLTTADRHCLSKGQNHLNWAKNDKKVAGMLVYRLKNIWQRGGWHNADPCTNPGPPLVPRGHSNGLGLIDRCGVNGSGDYATPETVAFYHTLLNTMSVK